MRQALHLLACSMITYDLHGALPARFPKSTLPRLAREFGRVQPSKHRKLSAIGLSFVSPLQMQRLNREHRGKNRPTDVLSFSLLEGSDFPAIRTGEPMEIGDIVICPTVAREESKRRGIDLEEELVRLVAHGTLHLLGYDHATEPDEDRMFGIQERVVASVMKTL